MKSAQQILLTPDPKKNEKIIQAATNGNSMQFLDAFRAELSQPGATDFPNIKTVCTASFICDYHAVGGMGKAKTLTIIPLVWIHSFYRSNIVNGQYDLDSFHFVCELTNGAKMLLCPVAKNKAAIHAYDALIGYLRSRMTNGGAQR